MEALINDHQSQDLDVLLIQEPYITASSLVSIRRLQADLVRSRPSTKMKLTYLYSFKNGFCPSLPGSTVFHVTNRKMLIGYPARAERVVFVA